MVKFGAWISIEAIKKLSIPFTNIMSVIFTTFSSKFLGFQLEIQKMRYQSNSWKFRISDRRQPWCSGEAAGLANQRWEGAWVQIQSEVGNVSDDAKCKEE